MKSAELRLFYLLQMKKYLTENGCLVLGGPFSKVHRSKIEQFFMSLDALIDEEVRCLKTDEQNLEQ